MGPPGSSRRLRGWARGAGLSRAARSAAHALGYDLVRRHFYSPIPDLSQLPVETWDRESDLPGVAFDPEAGLEFLERELAAYLAEYTPPRVPTGAARDFHLENGFYESVDAETLYAMVRRFSPGRVIELGSGMSTLVIADARERNGRTDRTEHLVFDPFPRPDLRASLDHVAELRPVSVTDVPLAEFERLGEGDVLFVDTTHTVKIGSDVNRIVLEILPALSSGVLIHFHDVFLPWEYPREFLEERRFFWNEQYLLQAFLAFNSDFEILFSAQALQRRYPDRLATLVRSAGPGISPSALWLRRVG